METINTLYIAYTFITVLIGVGITTSVLCNDEDITGYEIFILILTSIIAAPMTIPIFVGVCINRILNLPHD